MDPLFFNTFFDSLLNFDFTMIENCLYCHWNVLLGGVKSNLLGNEKKIYFIQCSPPFRSIHLFQRSRLKSIFLEDLFARAEFFY